MQVTLILSKLDRFLWLTKCQLSFCHSALMIVLSCLINAQDSDMLIKITGSGCNYELVLGWAQKNCHILYSNFLFQSVIVLCVESLHTYVMCLHWLSLDDFVFFLFIERKRTKKRGECCVFQPVKGCLACHLLMQMIFWCFDFFFIKIKKNESS